MIKVRQLAIQLHRAGLHVREVTQIDYGHQIRLICGIVVNVYNTGKVLVQGKMNVQSNADMIAILYRLLPVGATFPPSMKSMNWAKPKGRLPKTHFNEADIQWVERIEPLALQIETIQKPENTGTSLPSVVGIDV